MKRKGLFALVAVLMALALFVRSENSALAQGNITYFDYTGGGAFPVNLNLGNTVTLQVDTNGTWLNTNANGLLTVDKPTFNHPDTVFMNVGGTSAINAESSGAVISTLSANPAIMNGVDNTQLGDVDRYYQVRVTLLSTGSYRIEYGWYWANDPLREWHDATYEELPKEIQDYELPTGTKLWNNSNTAVVPAGYTLAGINLNQTDAQGQAYAIFTGSPPSSPVQGFTIIDPNYNPLDPNSQPPPNIPQGVYDDTVLPPQLQTGGGVQTGTLVINPRDSRDLNRQRFVGDGRTLIQSNGTAIENHGTLTVNDSRIQAVYGTGILHVFSRGTIYIVEDTENTADSGSEDSDVITDVASTVIYGAAPGGGLYLNNTQIGEPGTTYISGYDPNTGQYTTTTYGVKVDSNGTPIQTTSRIYAGDIITVDGVNGRITVGQNITVSRNPIGEIGYRSPSSDAQYTIYDSNYISGPSVGILAQAHNLDPHLTGERVEHVYDNRYLINSSIYGYESYLNTGSYIYNHIQLNDNSWIFADTGISFGNVDTYTKEGSIRITIDSTSGIYAGGYGSSYYYGYGSYLYYGGGTGITDRYSLLELEAHTGAANSNTRHTVDGYSGYSGSFHEIQVDGKVIAGAPSRAGIQISFGSTSNMSQTDKDKLAAVFYYDPNDEYADRWGNVYYYDPNRTDAQNSEVASRFSAYNTQPNRVFWLKIDGRDPVPLTYYDYDAKRWTVHPDAPTIRINTGEYSSSDPRDYFSAFDVSYGVGIEIVGTSMAYEGRVRPTGVQEWSTYYGPTVRVITALGNDALIAGGELYSGGAAMSFGSYAHVANVVIGENKDVKNLSNVLFVPNDFSQSAKNYQAFDMMTSTKRGTFLYDPTLLYDRDEGKFHFDNAGVHGDIVSQYNPVVYLFGGSGTRRDGTNWSLSYAGVIDSFWAHGHPGAIYYYVEVLGMPANVGNGNYYLLGHRDMIGPGSGRNGVNSYWTMEGGGGASTVDLTADDDGTTTGTTTGTGTGTGTAGAAARGRSLILDEILYYFLQGRQFQNSNNYSKVSASLEDTYGYADNALHFREAMARYLHYSTLPEYYAGLSVPELLAGYTRDGTLVVFTNGDIYSGHIYGSGIGDQFVPYGGSVDLRFVDGTTIFNNNVIERVVGTDVVRDPGIRVRDVYVEKTGHLLLNDAQFSVNPFIAETSSYDYADRLLVHDVYNEGIVSGNGVFQIAERWNYDFEVNYFKGYFVNRGILAPGLPGFIGESEYLARELEKTAYDNMLDTVSNSSGDALWQQLMRGVPGGQFGTIDIFGSLYLMDEITRPVYDPTSPLYNTDETVQAGEYHVTIGNDTIADMFGKYVSTIANATSVRIPVWRPDGTQTFVYDDSVLQLGEVSKEDWKVIAMEKLGTHLSWFSTSAMVDTHTGLPLLSQYEQFEYLTDPGRRTELQRQILQTVLTPQELRLYDSDPVQRAVLNKKLWDENNVRFEFTQLDNLLWRYGFSDIVSVHGTIPPYYYERYGWNNQLYDQGSVPPPYYSNPANAGNMLLGVTQLGGVIQADRIYDMDGNADSKEKQTSFIVIASEGYTFDGSVKAVTSATNDWVYANVDVLPLQMASGQTPTVLTVIDDPNYYLNRVSKVGDSFNARSVAGALDKAMQTNPGLAQSFQFGLNSPEVLNDVLRQVASSTRANSVVMNAWSPSDNLFNQIGYGHGGLSTGNRGNVVFRNMQTGRLQQPYGQPAVPPPGHQYAPYQGGQTRGQSPFARTGSVWGAYTHSSFSMGDDGNSYKFTFDRNGVIIGSEWNLTPSSVLGSVAVINNGTLNSFGDKVESYDYDFGLYFVAAPFEQFELKSYISGGFQSYKTDRYIRNSEVFIGNNANSWSYSQNDIFGIYDHYDSETQGYSFNYAVEFARPFTTSPNFVIRPAVGFEIQSVRQKAYSEQKNEGSKTTWSNNGSNIADYHYAQGAKNGTYGMDYNAMTFARSLVRFGVNTESYFSRGGWQFRGYYIQRLTGDRYPISEQSFSSGSSTFSVRGAELGSSFLQVGLGSHLWLNRDRTATLFMNGDWNFSMLNSGHSLLNLMIGLQQSF